MKISNSSTVPVYTVSGLNSGKSLPEWLTRRRKRSSKANPEDSNRIELLQDFGFEEASSCVRVCEDGQWVMSTGTYKPQIHTHNLSNLSLSWARHTNTLNKTFTFLSSGVTKTAHLQADRSIEFHTLGGCHHNLRLPRYGRDLVWQRSKSTLLVPCVGVNANGKGEVHRISLSEGRFMREFEIEVGGDDFLSMGGGALQGGINTGSVNTAAVATCSHDLLAFGTSIGTVEFWDPRQRVRITQADVPRGVDGIPQVTALDFHDAGIKQAVGCSDGMIYIYDLRSPVPILTKDHGYGYPVQNLEFLNDVNSKRFQSTDPKVMSSDKRIIKLWDESSGDPWTSVEPAVDINCVAWCPDSGMFLTANEGPQQHAFLIPQLGPAPKWCSFLDNIIEEMAEDDNDPSAFSNTKSGETYDNYKFLDIGQLQRLSLDGLIGKTDMLRPYMHGYFVDQKLYEEARLIANPVSAEEERIKGVKTKIEKERESRIRGQKKVKAKVNRKLAEKALDAQEKQERRRAQRVLAQGGDVGNVPPAVSSKQDQRDGLLEDDRFGRLFQDEDFQIDETSREFQALNPSTRVSAPLSNLDREKGLTAVEQELVDEVPRSSDDEDSANESDETAVYTKKPDRISDADYKRRPQKKKPMQMRISKTNGSKPKRRDQSFGTRAASYAPKERARRAGGVTGEKMVTFEPAKKNKSRASGPSYDQTGSIHKDRRSASGNAFRRM